MSVAINMYIMNQNNKCLCDEQNRLHIDKKYPIKFIAWSYKKKKRKKMRKKLLKLGMGVAEFNNLLNHSKLIYYGDTSCRLKLQKIFDCKTYDRIRDFQRSQYGSLDGGRKEWLYLQEHPPRRSNPESHIFHRPSPPDNSDSSGSFRRHGITGYKLRGAGSTIW